MLDKLQQYGSGLMAAGAMFLGGNAYAAKPQPATQNTVCKNAISLVNHVIEHGEKRSSWANPNQPIYRTDMGAIKITTIDVTCGNPPPGPGFCGKNEEKIRQENPVFALNIDVGKKDYWIWDVHTKKGTCDASRTEPTGKDILSGLADKLEYKGNHKRGGGAGGGSDPPE